MRSNALSRAGGMTGSASLLLLTVGGLALGETGLAAQTLKGSTASLDRQELEAQQHDFTYLRTSAQVRTFVELGLLVQVKPNSNFELHQVSFPYARPEVRLFVERLAEQYRDSCRDKMVVTSLTRPMNRQPANASDRSVHPTGMAVDLRIPPAGRCRTWLEGVLLQLEGADVLEATRERNPAHYHIVLFPREYTTYVDRMTTRVAQAVEVSADADEEAESSIFEVASEATAEDGSVEEGGPADTPDAPATYRVRRGDSLWTIAQKLGTTVERIRAENALRSNRIYAGQVIIVPGR